MLVGVPVALRTFGGLGKGRTARCGTRLSQPLGPLDKAATLELLNGLATRRKTATPIGAALAAVPEDLASVAGPRTVVLVTDGEETCKGDPAAVMEALRAVGLDVTVNIVGFALKDEALKETMAAWATGAGGTYVDATGAEELASSIQAAVNAPFRVLGPDGRVAGGGTVGGAPVTLDPGTYLVEVLVDPPVTYREVVVGGGQDVALVLPMSGEEPRPGCFVPVTACGGTLVMEPSRSPTRLRAMFIMRRPSTVPSPTEALPGRSTPMPVPASHVVLGTPIAPPWPQGIGTAVFGLGCFWGAEKAFWQLPGVYSTAVGYAGGFTPNPTYEEVCSGRTGHAEVVLVAYDPDRVSYEELLRLFWEHHDPTQGMRQGNDVGTQYRSTILWADEAQRSLAEATRDRYQERLRAAGYGPITTEIAPLGDFFHAEAYHQQYLAKDPDGYCPDHSTGVACPIGTGIEAGARAAAVGHGGTSRSSG
jgi:peptide-methionine (S)-S-oxide reductase